MSVATSLIGIRRLPGRHRGNAPLPAPPDDKEKLSYIDRYLPYLALVITIGNCSVIASQSAMEIAYHIWALVPWTAFSAIYVTISVMANFTGRGFDFAAHEARVRTWQPSPYPDIDIFLPVCGESVDLLHNTWVHVFELVQAYMGRATAYVLDDGADPHARALAADFGFRYVVREDRPWMKKSGNLRYAFARTHGEFFVVLDADFAPRADLLAETLPYFDDPKVAIIQTPQFFRTNRRQTWVERSAGAVQEVFYRSMQVSRDSLDASICVGTCALYRRKALQAEGGTTLIAYAEDVHTGLDARRNGWTLKYIPVVLATGICPDTVDAFVRQQYRWCLGSTTTLLTRRLWRVPMSIRSRLSYVSGFAYYLFTASLTFVGPVIPLGLLAYLPRHIQPHDYLLLAPALINGMVLYPVWHRCGYGPSTWPLAIVRGWAHALALWDYSRGKVMAWQSTGGGVSPVRRLWAGLWIWNGGAALAWLVLAAWRSSQYGPARFSIISVFGVIYAVTVAWILFTRKAAS
jgi:cellulose synthase (UDP-forming)